MTEKRKTDEELLEQIRVEAPMMGELFTHYSGLVVAVTEPSIDAETGEIRVNYRHLNNGESPKFSHRLVDWNKLVEVGGKMVRRFRPFINLRKGGQANG